MSEYVDEIQLQVGVTEGEIEDKIPHNFELSFEDAFGSDEFKLKKFSVDDVQQYELGKLLLKMQLSNWDFKLNLEGGGVGKIVDGVLMGGDTLELDTYPGETDSLKDLARMSYEFSGLRYSLAKVEMGEGELSLLVTSFTDPVKSGLSRKSDKVKELKENKFENLTDNEVLSALRTYHLAERIIGELWLNAHYNFEKKVADKLKKTLKHELEKSVVRVKDMELSYSNYLLVVDREFSYFELIEERIKLIDEEIAAKLQL